MQYREEMTRKEHRKREEKGTQIPITPEQKPSTTFLNIPQITCREKKKRKPC